MRQGQGHRDARAQSPGGCKHLSESNGEDEEVVQAELTPRGHAPESWGRGACSAGDIIADTAPTLRCRKAPWPPWEILTRPCPCVWAPRVSSPRGFCQTPGTAGFSSPFGYRGLPCLCATPVSRSAPRSHCGPGCALRGTDRPRGASSPSRWGLFPWTQSGQAPSERTLPAQRACTLGCNNSDHLAVSWGLCAGDGKDFNALSPVGPSQQPWQAGFATPVLHGTPAQATAVRVPTQTPAGSPGAHTRLSRCLPRCVFSNAVSLRPLGWSRHRRGRRPTPRHSVISLVTPHTLSCLKQSYWSLAKWHYIVKTGTTEKQAICTTY